MSYNELNDYSELVIENKKLKAKIKILLEADKIREELLEKYRKENEKLKEYKRKLLHVNINLRSELSELEKKKYAPLVAAQMARHMAEMALGYGLAGVASIIGHGKGSGEGSESHTVYVKNDLYDGRYPSDEKEK